MAELTGAAGAVVVCGATIAGEGAAAAEADVEPEEAELAAVVVVVWVVVWVETAVPESVFVDEPTVDTEVEAESDDTTILAPLKEPETCPASEAVLMEDLSHTLISDATNKTTSSATPIKPLIVFITILLFYHGTKSYKTFFTASFMWVIPMP